MAIGGDLTAEQRTIAERPADTQTVVVGGPGTGKTHTLAARVEALLDRGDVGSADEVLVVSFTRAAVAELCRRLSDHPVARLVRPVTIDAFARRVVERHAAGTSRGDFDRTISEATGLLSGPDHEHYRHVIVDEVQDLAEPRMSFIAKLLAQADGFTVLGDPDQGIYGFRSNQEPNAVARLESLFPGADTLFLTENHRIRTPGANLASWAQDELAGDRRVDAYAGLVRSLRDAPHVSEAALAVVLRNADGGSAVVCRNGGEVLVLSKGLHEHGVRHHVQPGAGASVPPAWVARVLAQVDGERLTRPEFVALWGDDELALCTAAWNSLVRVAATDGKDDLRIENVRRRVHRLDARDAPDQNSGFPVVSTIHRIKGLEFDRVFVLAPAGGRDDVDDAEEARVLYVALTRARDETLMVERPDASFAVKKRAGRWIAAPWRSDRLLRVEVRVGDIDRAAPFTEDGSSAYIQRHLRTRVAAGDAVILERQELYGRTTYVVMHKGLPIASTTSDFAAALDRLGVAPSAISDVYVGELSSAAGDPEAFQALDVGPGGFWLVPELSGFGKLL